MTPQALFLAFLVIFTTKQTLDIKKDRYGIAMITKLVEFDKTNSKIHFNLFQKLLSVIKFISKVAMITTFVAFNKEI